MSMGDDSTSSPIEGLDQRLVTRSRRFSGFVATFSVALGCVVLAGWLLGIPVLKSFLPSGPTMKVNAAIGFATAGLALWWLRSESRDAGAWWAGRIGAAVTLGIGLLTALEYATGRDLGIDQWLIREPDAVIYPGRMSPGAAFHFLIIGAALLLLDSRGWRGIRASPWLALLGLIASLFILTSYAYGLGDPFRSTGSPAMALPAAIGFSLLSAGLLLARPALAPVSILFTDSLGGLVARKFLPALICVFFLLGLIRMIGQWSGLFGVPVGVSFSITSSTIISSAIFLWQARAISRIDSERRAAEDSLRASERIYRAIGESIPFGVWVCDPSGSNTYASDSFLKLVGLTQDQCSSMGWTNALHPDDASRTIAAWKKCVRVEGEWEIEHRFLGTDSQYHPVLARGVPVRDEAGTIVCWAGINLDISRVKATEDALRQSETRQRLALEAARLANWEWDPRNDRITYLERLPLLHGRSEDQPFLDYDDYLAIVHPDDRDNIHGEIQQSLKTGVPFEAEYRIVWPDGSIRWLASRGSTFFDADGQPLRIIGVNLDITDRKKAETEILQLNESLERRVEERTNRLAEANEALRSQERRYRAIFNSTFQFVGLLSPNGILLEANQTALDFGGLSREEVVGQPFWECRWWSGDEATQARLQRSIRDAAAGEFVRYEVDVRGAGDLVATIDFSLKPLFDHDNRITLLIPEGRDITEQKRAAEALRRSEAELRESHRLAGLGSWSWDLDTNVMVWSEELYRISGRDSNLPAPAYAQQVEIYTPQSFAQLDEAVTRAVTSGEAYEVELEMIRADGESVWIIGRGEVIHGPDGRVVMLRGTIQDVSARKRFEEELRRARDQAMAATKAKSEFLANMSHEIRTPMNGVLGMTELLLDTPLNPLQADYARIIKSSGDALLTVINDILDFSKIEAGKLTIEVVEFDLRNLIDEVANLLLPRAKQKKLEVECRVDPGIPATLLGDPIRIRQILTNLAGNAVKFTDVGKVTIEAVLITRFDDQARIQIQVKDTGVGIPLEHQTAIFESFTQVESGNRRSHGGTGLGLTICRSLVTLMGGEIGLESSPDQGSTFWFELILAVPSADITRSGPSPGESETSGGKARSLPVPVPSSTAIPRAFRVLLAEDHPVNQRVAIGLLARLGCHVESVENGRILLDTLDYDRHDLILMDVQMPVMDGIATTAAIRERERETGRHIPIIAITAFAMKDDLDRCLDAGMDGYLAKPIRFENLREVILQMGRKFPEPRSTEARHESLQSLLQALEPSCGDDPSRIAEVLKLLVTTADDQIKTLREAVASSDTERVRAEAHALTGAFLTVGLDHLAGACQRLFDLAVRGDHSNVEIAVRTIVDHWNRLREDILRELDSSRGWPGPADEIKNDHGNDDRLT